MTNHENRIGRACLALDGLSVGDAFGERFFLPPGILAKRLESRTVPPEPWFWTDDTAMAISVVEVLADHEGIQPDALARAFADRYAQEPARGYGGMAHRILQMIRNGVPWRRASADAFDGQGSMGNGAAMRVAPVGAYFADDLDAVERHARASAEVTHAHPEGIAGAVAVALAAAYAVRVHEGRSEAKGLLEFVSGRLASSEVRGGLMSAMRIGREASVQLAVEALGNGSRVTAPDTVPFALWCADTHLGLYEEALWQTVSGLGDSDTTCAMVGGIVALATGREGIPSAWLAAREPLPRLPATL